MFSLSLARDLVNGALALSLLGALSTIVAVVWGAARARHRRWRWALATPIVACVPAAWIWLHPSFVIGAIAGGELGAEVGHHLSPTADASLMAMGMGLGTYVVFTAPLAALALLVSLAVTTPQTLPARPRQPESLRTVRIGFWGPAIGRLAVSGQRGIRASFTLPAVRFGANILERIKRYKPPRPGGRPA